jgi:predicted dehydrogenase
MKQIILSGFCILLSCSASRDEIRLITLDPGHFHAALIQKTASQRINDSVYVYAPRGKEVDAHLDLIDSYNSRPDNPAAWCEIVYTGTDFLERMMAEKKGNVVILAGNNRLKTSYILKSVEAGLNVLADKPMVIDASAFSDLEEAYRIARQKKVVLYDIMTERYAGYNIVNRALMQDRELFGELWNGTHAEPAVELNSVHHFYKEVSGKPLVRPAWYYDVKQQGEGIVDVTTHLIDLVHWKCFPDIPINYKEDIQIIDASHRPTAISRSEFSRSTLLSDFPPDMPVDEDSVLQVYANGSIHYTVKGVHVGITVSWNFEAPADAGDMHRSVMKGTKASLHILQGEEQGYIPRLYVVRNEDVPEEEFSHALHRAVEKLKPDFSIEIIDSSDNKKELRIQSGQKSSHEDHFAFVADRFFDYVLSGNIPEWEIANTLTKYYITTTALSMARQF